MSNDLPQPKSPEQGDTPDLGRRRMFKAAIKGAAIGAPLILTLRGGNAWADSLCSSRPENWTGGAVNAGTLTNSCMLSVNL